ncbi:polygalacturonase [Thioclava dalianensis]|uniref:Polygalacturonase n=2 Tax=Thioclava dalianensis TaxID=1185766 RepID=A0A074U2U6_9RHOB|nr:polygalacturonase [Thioclava dalianensis]SFN73154.1 Polygalacturonase [Thioclava dalianensis]
MVGAMERDVVRQVRIAADDAPITERVQALLDHDDAPLHLVLEPGLHRAAGLRLRSDVTLEILAGAELHFLPGYDQYAGTKVAIVAEESDRAMLCAADARNIALVGGGQIFGAGSTQYVQGEDVQMGTRRAVRYRPRVVVFDACENIRIEGLHIEDAPMWTMHFAACTRIRVHGLSVDNDRRMPNTDGIVIDGCRDVEITNSVFRTADDGIVLKTTRREDGTLTGPCEDVIIRDCVIESRSCAIKLGTESFSAFRRITCERVDIEKSNRGLGILSRDGGVVEDIRFAQITLDCHETPEGFWGSGEAVTITVIDRRPEEGPAGSVRGVVIEDVHGKMEGALCFVSARADGISDLTLRRVTLEQVRGVLGTAAKYDLRPTEADRFDRFPLGDGNAGRVGGWCYDAQGRIIGLIDYPGGMPGLYIRGVRDLKTEALSIIRPDPLPPEFNVQLVVTEEADGLV